MIKIIFKSRSFLQQQVRSMVGCLKFVGEGKWSINDFKKILPRYIKAKLNIEFEKELKKFKYKND